MSLRKEKGRALLCTVSMPCDLRQVGAASTEALARRQALGRPRRWPRCGRKGKQQQGGFHPVLLCQLGPAAPAGPRAGIPVAPCRLWRGHRLPSSKALHLFPRPLRHVGQRGQSPLQNSLGAALPSRDPARRGLCSPTALLEAAQTHLHSACSRHPETACAGEQQGYPKSPGRHPKPVTSTSSAGAWPRGVRGALSKFPKPRGCCSAHHPGQLPRHGPHQPHVRLCLCYPAAEAPRRNKPHTYIPILRGVDSSLL